MLKAQSTYGAAAEASHRLPGDLVCDGRRSRHLRLARLFTDEVVDSRKDTVRCRELAPAYTLVAQFTQQRRLVLKGGIRIRPLSPLGV
jgi:hypothetical protein